MKQPVGIVLIVVALGALVWLIVRQTGSTPPTNTAAGANTAVSENVSVAGTNTPGGAGSGSAGNTTDRIVRGPYPKDADGCYVIDLTDVPPTEHDQSRRVYTWIIEHPENASCLRQIPPKISEEVKDSFEETIRGTNMRRRQVFYSLK